MAWVTPVELGRTELAVGRLEVPGTPERRANMLSPSRLLVLLPRSETGPPLRQGPARRAAEADLERMRRDEARLAELERRAAKLGRVPPMTEPKSQLGTDPRLARALEMAERETRVLVESLRSTLPGEVSCEDAGSALRLAEMRGYQVPEFTPFEGLASKEAFLDQVTSKLRVQTAARHLCRSSLVRGSVISEHLSLISTRPSTQTMQSLPPVRSTRKAVARRARRSKKRGQIIEGTVATLRRQLRQAEANKETFAVLVAEGARKAATEFCGDDRTKDVCRRWACETVWSVLAKNASKKVENVFTRWVAQMHKCIALEQVQAHLRVERQRYAAKKWLEQVILKQRRGLAVWRRVALTMSEIEREKAALSIETQCRRHFFGKRRAQLKRLTNATAKVNGAVRRFLAVRRVVGVRYDWQRDRAAGCIGRALRRALERRPAIEEKKERRVQKRRLRRNKAAVSIQSRQRARESSRRVEAIRKKRTSAVTIQRVIFRGTKGRGIAQKFRLERDERLAADLRKKAAVSLQKMARGKEGRSRAREAAEIRAQKLEHEKRQAHAASTLQRRARGCITRNRLRKRAEIRSSAATVLQSLHRGRVGRRDAELRRDQLSAEAKRAQAEAKRLREEAILRKEQAAVKLQSQARRLSSTRRVHDEKRRQAATKIQVAARRALARKVRAEKSRQRQAAMEMQRVARGRLGRRRFQKKVDAERARSHAASTLQRILYRGAKGRARASCLKTRRDVALAEEALKTRLAATLSNEATSCAIELGAVRVAREFRRALEIAEEQKALEEKLALEKRAALEARSAVIMQSAARAHLERLRLEREGTSLAARRVAKHALLRQAAALRIQAWVRGRRVHRAYIERRRFRREALDAISSSAADATRAAFQARDDVLSDIQTSLSCYVDGRGSTCERAAARIQSRARGDAARKTLERRSRLVKAAEMAEIAASGAATSAAEYASSAREYLGLAENAVLPAFSPPAEKPSRPDVPRLPSVEQVEDAQFQAALEQALADEARVAATVDQANDQARAEHGDASPPAASPDNQPEPRLEAAEETVEAASPVEAAEEKAETASPIEASVETTDAAAPVQVSEEKAEAASPIEALVETTEAAVPADAAAQTTEAAAPADAAVETTEAASPADAAAETTEAAPPADAAAETTEAATPADAAAETTEAAAPVEASEEATEASPADAAAETTDAASPVETAVETTDAVSPVETAVETTDAVSPVETAEAAPVEAPVEEEPTTGTVVTQSLGESAVSEEPTVESVVTKGRDDSSSLLQQREVADTLGLIESRMAELRAREDRLKELEASVEARLAKVEEKDSEETAAASKANEMLAKMELTLAERAGQLDEQSKALEARIERLNAAEADDWIAYYDDASQSTYYYNATTGETTWDLPYGATYRRGDDVLPSPADGDSDEVDDLDSPAHQWLEYWDESAGARYWYNTVTHEASWTPPDALACTTSPNRDSGPSVPDIFLDDEPDQDVGPPPLDEDPHWSAVFDPATGRESWIHDKTGEVWRGSSLSSS